MRCVVQHNPAVDKPCRPKPTAPSASARFEPALNRRAAARHGASRAMSIRRNQPVEHARPPWVPGTNPMLSSTLTATPPAMGKNNNRANVTTPITGPTAQTAGGQTAIAEPSMFPMIPPNAKTSGSPTESNCGDTTGHFEHGRASEAEYAEHPGKPQWRPIDSAIHTCGLVNAACIFPCSCRCVFHRVEVRHEIATQRDGPIGQTR